MAPLLCEYCCFFLFKVRCLEELCFSSKYVGKQFVSEAACAET